MTHRLVAIALLICFTTLPAAAQTSATLVGVVQDAQGGRLPGVSVASGRPRPVSRAT